MAGYIGSKAVNLSTTGADINGDAIVDGTLDVLGAATGTDLTLSGGLYVGGAVAANYLDDYEEGEWTPSVKFGGGEVGIAYALRRGTYTKIGDVVTVQGYTAFSNKGSSVGSVTIQGLPFNANSLSGSFSNITLWINNVTFADYPQGYITVGTSNVLFGEILNSGGATTTLTNTNFVNTSEVMFTVVYRV